MKLITILDKIYSGNDDLIVGVIASSKYVKNHVFDDAKSLVINMGLSFRSHKGNEFALFYDIYEDVIIRQMINPGDFFGILPHLGLRCFPENGYLNLISQDLIVALSTSIELFGVERFCEEEYSNLAEKFPMFKIFEGQDSNNIIMSYPSRIVTKPIVFVGSNGIERYIDNDEFYEENDSYDDDDFNEENDSYDDDYQDHTDADAFRDATGGQCEGESWTSLGRD